MSFSKIIADKGVQNKSSIFEDDNFDEYTEVDDLSLMSEEEFSDDIDDFHIENENSPKPVVIETEAAPKVQTPVKETKTPSFGQLVTGIATSFNDDNDDFDADDFAKQLDTADIDYSDDNAEQIEVPNINDTTTEEKSFADELDDLVSANSDVDLEASIATLEEAHQNYDDDDFEAAADLRQAEESLSATEISEFENANVVSTPKPLEKTNTSPKSKEMSLDELINSELAGATLADSLDIVADTIASTTPEVPQMADAIKTAVKHDEKTRAAFSDLLKTEGLANALAILETPEGEVVKEQMAKKSKKKSIGVGGFVKSMVKEIRNFTKWTYANTVGKVKSFFATGSEGFFEGKSVSGVRPSMLVATSLGAAAVSGVMTYANTDKIESSLDTGRKLATEYIQPATDFANSKFVQAKVAISDISPKENAKQMASLTKDFVSSAIQSASNTVKSYTPDVDTSSLLKMASYQPEKKDAAPMPSSEFYDAAIAFLGEYVEDADEVNRLLDTVLNSYNKMYSSVSDNEVTVSLKLKENKDGKMIFGYTSPDDKNNTIILSSVNESFAIYDSSGELVYGDNVAPKARF